MPAVPTDYRKSLKGGKLRPVSVVSPSGMLPLWAKSRIFML